MKQTDLIPRTKEFAIRVMALCELLPPGNVGWNLGKQLMRSGTSIGANYREAQRSRTRQEFGSKIGICQQEADETQYWLELIIGFDNFPESLRRMADKLLAEANELSRILTVIGQKASV